MKKNILKTTALFIVLSGLLFSCTLFEDDSPSEIVTAVATKTEAAKKAVLSLSVAGEGAARTALPSVSSAQEFESFDFEANKGTDRITKSWTGDSEKSAYAKMTSESFEIDAGIWNFTLTAKKGGMTYTGTLNKELVAGANSIEFTLALSELSNEGKGSVEIKLSVPENVIAVTATLCDTNENEVSDSSITQSINLVNNTVSYSAQNVPSGTYLVVFSFYADTSKTLLLGKWREYAGITNDVTSKSEIAIAEDDLDKVYTITYELNGGTLKGNWVGSYTRQMILTFPTQKDLVNNEGLKFDGWYTDENLTNAFNSASLTGNLTLYARWKTISVDELIESIKNKSISDKAALVGEITSERLSEIVAAMNEAECYLALDLSMTKGLSSIGNEFKNCQYLTGISIPKTVTSIGYSAFSGCSGLTEMTIPFVGESVSATGKSSLFGYIFGISSYTGGTATEMYYSSSSSERYYIPSSLKTVTVLGGELKYGAFSRCSGLESVTIPSSVTSIGEWAFYGCSGLTSVTIPNSVTSIGSSAFYGCSGLTEMTIPFVGSSASSTGGFKEIFGGYISSSLKSVTLSEGMTSICDYAFSRCSGLESVAIPSSVTSIGKYAFSWCSGLKSVTIPSSVTSIGECAFRGCSGLKSVTIPGSVTSIWDNAFQSCSGLESVTLSEGLRSIGGSAFWGCSGLESVTIPSSVTSIRQYAFDGCSKLTSLTCLGKNRWNVGGHTGISLTVSKVRDKYLDMDWIREQSGGGSTQIGNVSNLRCTYLNMTKGSRKIILSWSGEATSLSFKFNGYTVNQKNVDFSANKVTLYEKDGDEDEKRYSVYCPNLGNSNSFVFIVNSESINVNF